MQSGCLGTDDKEKNDNEMLSYSADNMVTTLGVTAAKVGNLGNLRDTFKSLQDKGLNEAEMEQNGLSPEDIKLFKENGPDIIKKLDRVEELYNKNAKKYHDIAYDVTWKEVIKLAPEYGPKFRALTSPCEK